MMSSQVVSALLDAFPDKVASVEDKFYPAVVIQPEDLLEVFSYLKNTLQLDHLANLSSVDQGGEFAVVYHLHSFTSADKLMVTIKTPRGTAKVPSAIPVYKTADWQEREVYDLMGISFEGHPNLIRILLPYDYSGHPLRKDFKLVR